MSLVGNGFTVSDAITKERLQATVIFHGGDDLNFTGGTCGPEGDLGFFFGNCGEGEGRITIKKLGYADLDFPATFPIPQNIAYFLTPLVAPVTPIGKLTADGPVFKSDGTDWRYKGVSAFGLCNKFRNGENIDGFLDDYTGFNVLRVWDYVGGIGWEGKSWDSIAPEIWVAFCAKVATKGFHVELTLLTSDDEFRIEPAKRLVGALAAEGVKNLLIEVGNEPRTHKNINTEALRATVENSGFLYCSGDYEDSDKFYGTYYVNHTARNNHFPRYAHDLFEAYTGSGPDKPHTPFHVPCIGDEPGKIQDLGTVEKDWRALFGGYALMGGGGTFHSETGKTGARPTEAEKVIIKTVLSALDAFPPHAPRGPYRRIVEAGQPQDSRTYVVGNYAVRCQQVGTQFPEDGWTSLDAEGVLWARNPF